ncbi:MAG: fibrobacter succinogenes major paralogous domain-containing protein, partial [Prevotellaceae bacterium]|nr:fibrobacter succinogenes major paralogous domain-containing protein [Prevotellaceae bacterium]
ISSACKVTVNYKSSLQNDLLGLTRDTGLKLKLYVIYNDGDADRAIELNISLQDCACCGAYTASGVWKVFMCHNLGADETKDPFTISKDIHGAMYQFGVKGTAISQATNFANTGNISGWKTISGNGNWVSSEDPCPSGWRLPTKDEWQGVIDNNTISRTVNGGTTWVSPGTSLTWNDLEEDTGIKFGDALVLPAAGRRDDNDGTLDYRGPNGYYWGSTADGTNGYFLRFTSGVEGTHSYNRSYGFSVRCLSD